MEEAIAKQQINKRKLKLSRFLSLERISLIFNLSIMFRGPKDHGGKREEASCTEVFSVVTRMRWIPTLLDV